MVDRSAVQTAIFRLLQDEHGREALTNRPITFDSPLDAPGPTDLLQGMTAALTTARIAENIARDWAKEARAAGSSWDDIAKALGRYLPESDEPGHEAFVWAAPTPSMPHDAVQAYWRCPSCKQFITDNGPYAGHPDDEENGHGEGCARHAADLMAWKQRQGYDDDDF